MNYGLLLGILSLVVACGYLSYMMMYRPMYGSNYYWTLAALVSSVVGLVVLLVKNQKKLFGRYNLR